MTVLISWLAWFALLYQLYLQRVHNEKSLKPLGQIDLEDRQGHIYVRVTNNGLGPMIIDRLIFIKAGKEYTTIEHCLDLDAQSYTQISISESVRKVVLPNSHLVVFETRINQQQEAIAAQQIRQQLSRIRLKVDFRDIYDKRMIIERDFHWFDRHAEKRTVSE